METGYNIELYQQNTALQHSVQFIFYNVILRLNSTSFVYAKNICVAVSTEGLED